MRGYNGVIIRYAILAYIEKELNISLSPCHQYLLTLHNVVLIDLTY
jgi:hypothetical protein